MKPVAIMAWLKRDPLLALALGLLGLFSLIEIGYGLQRRRAAQRGEARWAKKRQERDNLCRISPAPIHATAAAIEDHLGKVNQMLTDLREALGGPASPQGVPGEGSPLVKGTDVFFDLATFAEKIRDQAAQSGVKTKPDERFGFSAYVHRGPDPEQVPAVIRQRIVMQYLAEALIAARPEQLIGFERENPVVPTEVRKSGGTSGGKRRSTPPPPASPLFSDLFAIDSRISVRVPQRVSTMAFRLTFVGQTVALRTFLNTIARSEHPLLVRALEVEPIPPARSQGESKSAPTGLVLTAESGSAPVLLVPRVLSKFIVTIECLESVPAGKNPANSASGVPAT